MISSIQIGTLADTICKLTLRATFLRQWPFHARRFGKPVEYEEATSAVSRENSFVFEFPVNPNLQSYDAVRYSSPTEGTDATSSTTQNAGHQSEASVGDRIEIKCENSSTEDKAMGQSWLGTWARRQKIFGLLAGPSEEKEERQVTAKAGKGKEIKDDSKKINEDFDEGALREQAWKWRFTRKWQVSSSALLLPDNTFVDLDDIICLCRWNKQTIKQEMLKRTTGWRH